MNMSLALKDSQFPEVPVERLWWVISHNLDSTLLKLKDFL